MNTDDLLALAKWAEPEYNWLIVGNGAVGANGKDSKVFLCTPNTIEPLWLANKDAIFDWPYIHLQEVDDYIEPNEKYTDFLEQTQSAEQRADVMVEWLRDTGQIKAHE